LFFENAALDLALLAASKGSMSRVAGRYGQRRAAGRDGARRFRIPRGRLSRPWGSLRDRCARRCGGDWRRDGGQSSALQRLYFRRQSHQLANDGSQLLLLVRDRAADGGEIRLALSLGREKIRQSSLVAGGRSSAGYFMIQSGDQRHDFGPGVNAGCASQDKENE
jgi:hypothetical protein